MMSDNRPWQVSTPTENGDKTYWTRIGSAWPTKNGNGGFNVVLAAAPINGKLTIQPPYDDDKPRRDDGGSKRGGGPDTGSKGGSFGDDDVPFLREDRG